MANLPKFEKLSAAVTSAILRNPKYKAGTPEWQLKGSNFLMPLEMVDAVFDYSLKTDKLNAIRKKDAQVFDEYIEFRNIIRVFGVEAQPAFVVTSGTLSEMYPPGIYKTTPKIKEQIGDHELCIRIGNGYLPIIFNTEKEEWEISGSKEPAVLRFDYGTVQSQEGEIKILIANCAIAGSGKATEKFTAKVGTKRDEKNKKKDAYPASEVQNAFAENNVTLLKEMLTVPPTGNGWTYTFADDRFEFGKYPVVSLKKEKRTKDTQSWFNYVVVVLDNSNSEVLVRLDAKDQTIWNTLSATYPWIDENGVSHNDSPEVDENDFLSTIEGENAKYCLVYYGKTKKSRTNKGQTYEYFETSVNFEEAESNSFQKLTKEEVASYSGFGKVATPAPKKTPITGVDDLLAVAEEELADSIPF